MKRKRLKRKRGGSLVSVMVTMGVLSIVGLAAASIALTNYRTTTVYTSQDGYYYSAESSQSQLTTHIKDVAYTEASSTDWAEDNAYKNYYENIYKKRQLCPIIT